MSQDGKYRKYSGSTNIEKDGNRFIITRQTSAESECDLCGAAFSDTSLDLRMIHRTDDQRFVINTLYCSPDCFGAAKTAREALGVFEHSSWRIASILNDALFQTLEA